ncbi:hypothetical protein L7F22_037902 [Adiantum nelumboides]|nr:hypothetical protein [Adiantum nelumboides]
MSLLLFRPICLLFLILSVGFDLCRAAGSLYHMQWQMAYLYSTSGCRKGYQHPTPMSCNGVSQRGFIKVSSGIPQKLEGDMQLMKARQDAMSEALKGRTSSPQTKRLRRKRTATAPVAIPGLPASQPLTQVKKARGLIIEGDILKVSDPLSEGRSEKLQLDSSFECTNRSTQGVNGNCTSTSGLDANESSHDASSNDNVAAEHGGNDNDNACIGGDHVARQGSQNSCGTGSIPAETAKETTSSQHAEIKQECGNDDNIGWNEGRVASQREDITESLPVQVLGSGDCNTESIKMVELVIVGDRVLQRAATDCSMESDSIDTVRHGSGALFFWGEFPKYP